MRRIVLASCLWLFPAMGWAQQPPELDADPYGPAPEADAEAATAASEGETAETPDGSTEEAATDVPVEPAPLGPAPSAAPPPSPTVAVRPAPDPNRPEDEAEMKWPDYFVAGLITMGAGVGFAIGGAVATLDGQIKDSLALGFFTTVAVGTGLPLALLGGADAEPVNSELVYAGTFVATTGAITAGLGGIIWMRREATFQRYQDAPVDPQNPGRGDEPDRTLPAVLVGVGAAGIVAGVVTWAFGAGHDDEAEDDDEDAAPEEARIDVAPGFGSLSVRGTF